MGLRKTTILIFLSALVVVISDCGSRNEDPIRKLELPFNEIMVVGESNNLPETELIKPSDVRVGPEGRIYIADPFSFKIQVYSPDGEYQFTFGREGRGPGEFTSVSGFELIDRSILLWDQRLQRLNEFNLDGTYLTSHLLKGILSPVNIHAMGHNVLLIFPDTHKPPVENRRLAHEYDRMFRENKDNFILVDEIDDRLEEVNDILTGFDCSILIINENRLLFVPEVYSGKLFEYSRIGPEGWKLTNQFPGQMQQTPYSLVDEKGPRKPDQSLHSVHLNEPLRLIMHNQSRGLFRVGEYIFHFIQTDREGRRIFGVEMYDLNLNPYGFSPIKSIPINSERFNTIAWYVDDMDNEGNFYFREYYPDSSRIRVMQVDVDGLANIH